MDINKAYQKASLKSESKVGLNIKIPISLKDAFDEACKARGVSMTAMMLSLVELVVDDYQANNIDPAEAMAKISELEEYFDDFSGPEDREDEWEFYKKNYELRKLKKLMGVS